MYYFIHYPKGHCTRDRGRALRFISTLHTFNSIDFASHLKFDSTVQISVLNSIDTTCPQTKRRAEFNELKQGIRIQFTHSFSETIRIHLELDFQPWIVYGINMYDNGCFKCIFFWIFWQKGKRTIDWDSTANGMVYGEMIAPLALTLHTQPVRYCLHCHLNEYSVYLWFHHLVFRLECEAFAAMPDLMSKNYATFYIAVLESRILNRNVQSLFTVSNRIIIIFWQKLPPALNILDYDWNSLEKTPPKWLNLLLYTIQLCECTEKKRTIATMADVQLIEIDRWRREKQYFHSARRLVAKGNQSDNQIVMPKRDYACVCANVCAPTSALDIASVRIIFGSFHFHFHVRLLITCFC